MKSWLSATVFLPAILIGFKSYGQDTASKLTVFVSPALFMPVTVAAQVSVQYKRNRQWAVLAEVAVPTFKPDDTPYEKISYWRAGLEVKHFSKRKPERGNYVSWQNNLLLRRLVEGRSDLYASRSQGVFRFQSAVIKSPVLSSAIKFGHQLFVGKRVLVDVFAGGGIRLLFTSYDATGVAPAPDGRLPDVLPLDGWVYNYTLARVHLTAGVRLGWSF